MYCVYLMLYLCTLSSNHRPQASLQTIIHHSAHIYQLLTISTNHQYKPSLLHRFLYFSMRLPGPNSHTSRQFSVDVPTAIFRTSMHFFKSSRATVRCSTTKEMMSPCRSLLISVSPNHVVIFLLRVFHLCMVGVCWGTLWRYSVMMTPWSFKELGPGKGSFHGPLEQCPPAWRDDSYNNPNTEAKFHPGWLMVANDWLIDGSLCDKLWLSFPREQQSAIRSLFLCMDSMTIYSLSMSRSICIHVYHPLGTHTSVYRCPHLHLQTKHSSCLLDWSFIFKLRPRR